MKTLRRGRGKRRERRDSRVGSDFESSETTSSDSGAHNESSEDSLRVGSSDGAGLHGERRSGLGREGRTRRVDVEREEQTHK